MNENRDGIAGAAVVLDPHPVCREGMRTILGRLGIEVVGETSWASPALVLVRERRPDLLVAEIETSSGCEEGLRLLRQAREHDHELAIVVLSGNGDPRRVQAALAHGATAYVLKSSGPDEVAAEIDRALAPSLFVAAGTADLPAMRTLAVADARDPRIADTLPQLTRREIEVLRLLEGRSNREVAKLLWVTDETVKFHLANIYRKLRVSSRADAVAWARTSGLLDHAVVEAAGAGRGPRVPLLGAWGDA